MKTVLPTERDAAFRLEFIALLGKYHGTGSSERLLAVAAYSVGQMVALQDQRTMTPDRAMLIVQKNIFEGNRAAVEGLIAKTAGRA